MQWEFPINPSYLTRWKKRLGEEGVLDLLKEIKNYLGRVVRDIERTIDGNDDLKIKFQHLLETAKRLMKQTKDSKNKLLKNDGKLGKNYLKGVIGDKINAVLSAVGHNIRLLLNAIVFLYLFWMQ